MPSLAMFFDYIGKRLSDVMCIKSFYISEWFDLAS